MKTSEAVREIMKEQGIGTTKMASRMDKTPRVVSDRLRQDNMSVSILNELLRVLDYKVIIVPRDTKLPRGGFEID